MIYAFFFGNFVLINTLFVFMSSTIDQDLQSSSDDDQSDDDHDYDDYDPDDESV